MNLIIKNSKKLCKPPPSFRLFATFNFDKEVLDSFPWKFGNRQTLITPSPNSDFYTIEELNKKLDQNYNGMNEGFKLAFYTLFDALSKRDMVTVGQISESRLREAFSEGFESLTEEKYFVEPLNGDKDINHIRVELIDFARILGAGIDRL